MFKGRRGSRAPTGTPLGTIAKNTLNLVNVAQLALPELIRITAVTCRGVLILTSSTYTKRPRVDSRGIDG